MLDIYIKIFQDEKTQDIEEYRKFKGFQEIGEVKGNTRDFHMDMGAFQENVRLHFMVCFDLTNKQKIPSHSYLIKFLTFVLIYNFCPCLLCI